jgi:hypothetical protein
MAVTGPRRADAGFTNGSVPGLSQGKYTPSCRRTRPQETSYLSFRAPTRPRMPSATMGTAMMNIATPIAATGCRPPAPRTARELPRRSPRQRWQARRRSGSRSRCDDEVAPARSSPESPLAPRSTPLECVRQGIPYRTLAPGHAPRALASTSARLGTRLTASGELACVLGGRATRRRAEVSTRGLRTRSRR